jgi:hypothetical protein
MRMVILSGGMAPAKTFGTTISAVVGLHFYRKA